MNNLKIKEIFSTAKKLVVAVLFVHLVSACSENLKKDQEAVVLHHEEPSNQVRFIGQWLNEGKREKLVRDFVLKYEFENQEVDVILKFPEEVYFDRSDQLSNQRFIADIMTKSNPEWDIIRLNNQFDEVVAFSQDSNWAKNYLVDFSQFPAFMNNTQPELVTQKAKDKWGGIIPGPFIEGQYWALWTNKRVSDKIGIEIKQYGMTVNDFISYLKAAYSYNLNHPDDYIVPIHDASDWRTAFAIAFNIYISALNDPDILFTKEITEPKLVAWHKTLQVLEEIAAFKPLNPNLKNVTWTDSRMDLVNEECLFYSNGSWMYNIWNQGDAKRTMNCYPNEFPAFKRLTTYPSSYQIMWGVLKNAPNRDEAVKFLLAMNTPDVAEMWVQYTKCPSGIKGKLTDVSFGSDQFETFSNYIQQNYRTNKYHYSEVICEYIIGNSNNLNTFYRAVLLGEMSADEAMEKIRDNLNPNALLEELAITN